MRAVLLAPAILAAVVSASLPVRGEAGEVVRGTAQAVEGDVLSLGGTVVRLAGIDAPDPGQTCHAQGGREYDCGEAARQVLAALLEGREVECTLERRPAADGRRVGACVSEGRSVAGALVVRGWAFAAIRLAPEYVRLQAAAQSRRTGMWAGRVEAPWNWRSRRVGKDRR